MTVDLYDAWEQAARLHGPRAVSIGPEIANDPDAYRRTGELDAKLIRVLAPETHFPVICDFGCGAGRVAVYLAQWYLGVRLVDSSPLMRDAAARAMVDAAPTFSAWVVVAGPGGEGEIDALCAVGVLAHYPRAEVPNIVRSWAEALPSGGRAIFTLPVGDAAWDRDTWDLAVSPGGMHVWDLAQIKELAYNNGFSPIVVAPPDAGDWHCFERH